MSQSRTPPIASTSTAYGQFQGGEEPPTSAPYSQSRFQVNVEAQSQSGQEHFTQSQMKFNPFSVDAPFPTPSMLPPHILADSVQKRSLDSHDINSPPTTLSDGNSPYTGPLDPYSPYTAMPLTPSSPIGPDEPTLRSSANKSSPNNPPPDLRRMSVQSIINQERSERNEDSDHSRQYPITDYAATTYGYDLGLPDLDTPNNEDYTAITIFSPQADTMEQDDETPYGSADPRSKDMAFESGGYYAKPVAIRISKSLGPLPPILMENQMNLLYFHHFLNHTARILVPHDCERNPFRQILPESEYFRSLNRHN